MSGLKRTFLDWSSPLLPEAARRIIARGPNRNGAVDLRSWMLVLPGRRAGRLMLSFLVEEAERSGVALVPPLITTPGAMLEVLVPVGDGSLAPASGEAVCAAWANALRDADETHRAPVLPNPPDADDWLAWHSIAQSLQCAQVELAGEGKSFVDVVNATAKLDLSREAERWEALTTIEGCVHRALAADGLVEPHTARRDRISRGDVDANGVERALVIGVPDMNLAQKDVLSALGELVEILVFAPERERDRFDEHGCALSSRWRDWRPSARDEQIITAGGAAGQAQAAIERIAILFNNDRSIRTSDLTIGLGEESLAPPLSRAAHWAGLRAHDAAGISLARTGPARFLEAAANWLREPRFVHLATLLRHPDVGAWLALHEDKSDATARESWITLLDRYFAEHLHDRFDGESFLGTDEERAALKRIHDRLSQLLQPLAGIARLLNEWVDGLRTVLATTYGDLEEREAIDDTTTEACVQLTQAFTALGAMPPVLQPIVEGATALRLLLASIRSVNLPLERRAEAIEMIGWLELALDPAPHLIITGFHDGSIPSRAESDAFLPDSIRTSLGLMDNDRRFARDAYLFETMLHSKESLSVIVGRRDARGEPLVPSRLLLAGDEETILRRVRLLCAEEKEGTTTAALPRGIASPAAESKFIVPALPESLKSPTHMNVTDFRLYLADPYRYALEKLLHLEPIRIETFEMDPLRFGSLAHQVLERFGNDPAVRNERDSEPIRDFLLDTLSHVARDRFGSHPLPAIRVQLARLEQRFRDFAIKQAQWREEGWRIEAVERRFKDEIALEIPGQEPMPLRASLDRIDRHETTGVVRIIDYKTSESGDGPRESHHGVKKIPDPIVWHDLQLPLYHHLLERAGVDLSRGVEIGYIVLPKQTDGVAFKSAEWAAEHLANAVETAREVVRNIRVGKFQRDLSYSSPFDPWARICHAQVLTSLDEADDEEDDA